MRDEALPLVFMSPVTCANSSAEMSCLCICKRLRRDTPHHRGGALPVQVFMQGQPSEGSPEHLVPWSDLTAWQPKMHTSRMLLPCSRGKESPTDITVRSERDCGEYMPYLYALPLPAW